LDLNTNNRDTSAITNLIRINGLDLLKLYITEINHARKSSRCASELEKYKR